jgi:hypothetical protein
MVMTGVQCCCFISFFLHPLFFDPRHVLVEFLYFCCGCHRTMLPVLFQTVCPDSAPFFGFMGITAAVVFAST